MEKERPPYKFNIGDLVAFPDHKNICQKGMIVEIIWYRNKWHYDIEDTNYRMFHNIPENKISAI